MPMIILFDTDILVDVGRDIEEAINCLKRIERQERTGISIITKMELIVGCRNKKELAELDKFLERFQVLSLNEAIADQTVKLLHRFRLSHGLLIADALIAATAIILKTSLITKNQRDYRFIDELKLIDYP